MKLNGLKGAIDIKSIDMNAITTHILIENINEHIFSTVLVKP